MNIILKSIGWFIAVPILALAVLFTGIGLLLGVIGSLFTDVKS